MVLIGQISLFFLNVSLVQRVTPGSWLLFSVIQPIYISCIYICTTLITIMCVKSACNTISSNNIIMELSFYIYGALTQIQLKMKKYVNIIFKFLLPSFIYIVPSSISLLHNLQDKAEIGLKVILINNHILFRILLL